MIRWLLSVFLCDHADRYKEREPGTGRLLLVCPSCGKAVRAIK